MKQLLKFIVLLLLPLQALAAASDYEAAIAKIFSERPYELDLGVLQAPDPKKIGIRTFSPDANPNAKGLQILSEGQVFPCLYEIISIENFPGTEIIDTVLNAQQNDPEAILLEKSSNEQLGTYIHYFRRVSKGGKPFYGRGSLKRTP